MERISNETAFTTLRGILESTGMRAAVIFLNELTTHRYTSVVIFDGPNGKHAYFYDRQNPAQEYAPDFLLHMSYCIYVKRFGAPFSVENAPEDSRVDPDHPKREVIRSYCGMPLTDTDGNVIGSACHYDSDSMPIAAEDVELLEAFSKMVPKGMYGA